MDEFFRLMSTRFLMRFLMEILRKETVSLLAPQEREEFLCYFGIMGCEGIQRSRGKTMDQDINAICVKWELQHLTGMLCRLVRWGHASMVANCEEWATSAGLPRSTSQPAAGSAHISYTTSSYSP